MSDDHEQPSDNLRRPIVNGIVALVAVAVAVGVILAGVALVGTRMLGIGEDSTAADGSTRGQTMVIPKPQKTTEASGPLVTLNTEEPATEEPEEGESEEATDEATEEKTKKAAEKAITLSAGQSSVANFGQIDLTGIYPGGEGAVLQVQRFESGRWADFDATIPVSGESFSTYVQTGVSGVNRFRVTDKSTGKSSNEVRVTVQG
ncbi:hypothetical protein [Nocardioides sambongensis]|uniref:hypothetical protein n=1 Tax=Nocardioides sambongensis TaxID=2589074 RepID=UPI0011281AA1|nr:hypothetical protein [Nocardioides sambongensis]